MTKILSETRRYKRYSDSVKLDARLVKINGKTLMEVMEKGSTEVRCPQCALVLSVIPLGDGFLTTYLKPADFHSRHRALEP